MNVQVPLYRNQFPSTIPRSARVVRSAAITEEICSSYALLGLDDEHAVRTLLQTYYGEAFRDLPELAAKHVAEIFRLAHDQGILESIGASDRFFDGLWPEVEPNPLLESESKTLTAFGG